MVSILKKPDIEKLQDDGFTTCDMHSHTQYSDGRDSTTEMVKKAQELGIGLCITDHNAIGGTLKLRKQKELFTIPAIEINTFEGPHILCYFYEYDELEEFYTKKIQPFVKESPNIRLKKTFEETIADAQNYNCVYSVAHPCGPVWTNLLNYMKEKRKRLLKKLPILETINGTQLRTSNNLAGKLAKEFSKGATGGSDAHIAEQVGKVLTCAKADSRERFLNAIKRRKNMVIGLEDSLLQRIMVHTHLMKYHLKYAATFFKQ